MYKIFIKYNKRCFSTWDESLTICLWYCSFQGKSWNPMLGLDRVQSCVVSQVQEQDPLHPSSLKLPRDPADREVTNLEFSASLQEQCLLWGTQSRLLVEGRIVPHCRSAETCQHVSGQAEDIIPGDIEADMVSSHFPCFWRQGGCAWGTELLGALRGELQSCTQSSVGAVPLQTVILTIPPPASSN